jgi:hypothetical protein
MAMSISNHHSPPIFCVNHFQFTTLPPVALQLWFTNYRDLLDWESPPDSRVRTYTSQANTVEHYKHERALNVVVVSIALGVQILSSHWPVVWHSSVRCVPVWRITVDDLGWLLIWCWCWGSNVGICIRLAMVKLVFRKRLSQRHSSGVGSCRYRHVV